MISSQLERLNSNPNKHPKKGKTRLLVTEATAVTGTAGMGTCRVKLPGNWKASNQSSTAVFVYPILSFGASIAGV